MPRANWAGNVVFSAARYHRPSSVAELQRLVAESRQARVLGTGHSFSPLADTPGDLISLAALPRLVEIDTAAAAVMVGAGLRYSDVAGPLQAAGRALRNLGSLPHISIAGACATGTHGSGVANGQPGHGRVGPGDGHGRRGHHHRAPRTPRTASSTAWSSRSGPSASSSA